MSTPDLHVLTMPGARIPHTGPARWTTLDGSKVLTIAGSPFAALPERGVPHGWYIFFIATRATTGWTHGTKEDVRRKLIETEREWIAQQERQSPTERP